MVEMKKTLLQQVTSGIGGAVQRVPAALAARLA
jgi:hypothetical protein